MNYLQNKVIAITGISKGIGKQLCLHLLEQGAFVAGWGMTVPEIENEKVKFFHCDVTREDQVKNAFEETLHWKGRVDILINNAGFGYFSLIENFDMEKFERMWEVNMKGAMLCSKICVPGMKERKSGHIVNISSTAGKVGAPQGEGYNSSKFALTGFSESIFHELREFGIKVTTVFPGSTATNFFDEIPGFKPNPNFMDAAEVAGMIVNVLNTSPNFLVREIEMRPLITKALK